MHQDNRNFRLTIQRGFVFVVIVLLSPLPLFAPLVSGNVDLDLAVSMKPNVVTATLQGAKDSGAYAQNLVFQIHKILHTEQAGFPLFVKQNANRIIYPSFIWPKRLCALETGQLVMAFFRLTQSGEQDLPARPHVMLMDIVPTSRQYFQIDQSLPEIRNLIRTDLLNQLKAERSSNRQIALLRFVYPLMRKLDAGVIRAFLKHPEREHRQAAHALLMALTLNPKYIPEVESDLKWILAHPRSDENADIAESCSGLIPPGFCDYKYLTRFTPYDGFPSEAEREARAPLLPLFRWVIQKVENPQIRWELGIKPLAFFGSDSDLPLLQAVSSQVDRIYRQNFKSALSRIRNGSNRK